MNAMIYVGNTDNDSTLGDSLGACMTWMPLLIGVIVGVFSGVVGVGGGILFVPPLAWS